MRVDFCSDGFQRFRGYIVTMPIVFLDIYQKAVFCYPIFQFVDVLFAICASHSTTF